MIGSRAHDNTHTTFRLRFLQLIKSLFFWRSLGSYYYYKTEYDRMNSTSADKKIRGSWPQRPDYRVFFRHLLMNSDFILLKLK